MAACGLHALPAHAPTLVLSGEGDSRSAGFGGLQVCGSAWECPVCARTVRHNHARELVRVATEHRAAGGHVYFLTLTLRHAFGDDLRALRRGLTDAWRRLIRGAPWKRLAADMGWEGYARAIDITHGANGWHPHLHALVFTDRRVRGKHVRRLARRWREVVEAEFSTRADPQRGKRFAPDVTTRTSQPSRRVLYATPGVRLDRCHSGDKEAVYIAKLGLEVAGPGKSRGATQWTVLGRALDELAEAERDGSVALERRAKSWRWVYLWRQYARAMRGARCLTWSRAIRARYAVLDDDDPQTYGRQELTFSARAWDLVRQRDAEVLEVAREAGARGVLEWLQKRDGIAFLETLALSRAPDRPACSGRKSPFEATLLDVA